jgi:HD-like signal output (HDOD) protein
VLRGQLLDVFSDPEYRPPLLPVVAIELVRLSRKSQVGITDIVHLLEKDQVLTADVLRLAQSVTFLARSDVRSIHEAIDRIGLNRAADLFLRASLESKIFRVLGYERILERLRRHSVATAEIGRLVCRQSRRDDNYAYMCGLLHDVGIAGALITIAGDFGVVAPVDFKVLWPVLSPIHAQFTVQLASLWGLPVELRAILRHHHTFAVEEHPDPMAAVTVLSEIVSAEVGLGFEGEQTNCLVDKALPLLHLSLADLEHIKRDAGELLASSAK